MTPKSELPPIGQPSGDDAYECYRAYVSRLQALREARHRVLKRELERGNRSRVE